MSDPFNITFVDYNEPSVTAAWLNAVNAIAARLAATPTTLTATAGQTVFTVPAGPSNSVFVDGVFQIPGTAYTWTSATQLTFTEGIHVGGKVTVIG